MDRFFNTAGPNCLESNYSIDPFQRIDWSEVQRLIDQRRYFVLHAPRQSGKTTLLDSIVKRLNSEGRYEALYVNVESAKVTREDYEKGDRLIAGALTHQARIHLPESWLARDGKQAIPGIEPGGILHGLLAEWASHAAKPTVLMVDEIDSLANETLVSVLGQLREGYKDRPSAFPQSVILCGVRDVREYRIETSRGVVTGASCLNVKAKSLRLGSFSEAEVRALYGQHTSDTGQVFDDPVVAKVMALSGGQPWLVNALANELTHEIPELRDRSHAIGLDDLDEAKERLILRRDTHIDQLVDKLMEDRVHRVIEPILKGEDLDRTVSVDDLQYVVDLGLVLAPRGEVLRIANDIYREVIPRELTSIMEANLAARLPNTAFLLPDGRLDMRDQLKSFQQFYRENSEVWRDRGKYEEAAPQLLLQVWLQRIVNGGGRIEREYALGTRRADLFVRHFYRRDGKRQEQRFVVEIKVVRNKGSLETTIEEGLAQTAMYAAKCDPEEAHLVVVDDRDGRSWDEKVFVAEKDYEGRPITVWGM